MSNAASSSKATRPSCFIKGVKNSDTSTSTERWLNDYLCDLAARPRQTRRDRPRSGLIRLLNRFDAPHARLNSIRVAGSKGKGTTARTLASILHAGGYRAGVFSSPHIAHWCERVRLGEQDVSARHLASVLARMAPAVEALRADPRALGPDFFEILLVAALVIFREAKVDIAIVEAGIGARGDATHCLSPILSILTTIEDEHLDVIGPTIADVAREKAAVARPCVPLVVGNLDADSRRIVESAAGTNDVTPAIDGRDFGITVDRQAASHPAIYRDAAYTTEVNLPGALAWLPDCAALAVAAARRLPDFEIDDMVIRDGLNAVTLPGRLERVHEQPLIVADGAHTAGSTERLAAMLATQPSRPRILVVSCSQGHDPAYWSANLWSVTDAIITTRAELTRSRNARDTASRIAALGQQVAGIQPDPSRALTAAAQRAGDHGMICATGSVYMVACARTYASTLERHSSQSP